MSFSALALIPARYSSSRFPGKPLVNIQGKSLLQRTYEQVKKSSLVQKIIIATDDKRIYEHALSFGAEAVYTSENAPTGSDRIAEVLKNDKNLLRFDAVVNIQGDEPCVDPSTIDKVIGLLRDVPTTNLTSAVCPIQSTEQYQNPHIVKCVTSLTGQALYFSRAPIPGSKSTVLSGAQSSMYKKHIGIYAYRPHFLLHYSSLPATPLMLHEDLEMLKVLEHGHSIYVVEVAKPAPDVNTPEDINEVIKWLKEHHER